MSSIFASMPNLENRIETGLGPITDSIVANLIDKITQSNIGEIVTGKIIDQASLTVMKKIRPYVITSIIMYLFLAIMLVAILIIIRKRC